MGAPFRTIKSFPEVFESLVAKMRDGKAIMLQVLQTHGVVSYLYSLAPNGHVTMQMVGVDPRMPLQRGGNQDRLSKWDRAESFGDNRVAFRKHLKNTMRNAHGDIQLWCPKLQRTESLFPVRLVTFWEPTSEAVPEVQPVAAATQLPTVIEPAPNQVGAAAARRRHAERNTASGNWLYLAGFGIFILLIAFALAQSPARSSA